MAGSGAGDYSDYVCGSAYCDCVVDCCEWEVVGVTGDIGGSDSGSGFVDLCDSGSGADYLWDCAAADALGSVGD